MNEPAYFVGIGCRKNISVSSLRDLFEKTLRNNAISPYSIAAIASIDSKRKEPGLLTLAANLNVPLYFFSAQELNRFSAYVDAAAPIVLLETDAANIAEASALALGGKITGKSTELIVRKCKNSDSTLAIAAATELKTTDEKL